MSTFPNVYVLTQPEPEVTDLGNGDAAWEAWDFWADPPPAFQRPLPARPVALELELQP